MLVSRRLLAFPLLPRSWARIGEAAGEFKWHVMDMLEEERSLQEERSLLAQCRTGTGSLITSSFVRALYTQQEEVATKSHNGQKVTSLTADEIYGNVFVINLASHDTMQILWHSVYSYLQQIPNFRIG